MTRTTRRTSRWPLAPRKLAVAGVVVAVLVGGCASTIAGSPEPNASAVAAVTGSSSSSTFPGTAESSGDLPPLTGSTDSSDEPSTDSTPTGSTPTGSSPVPSSTESTGSSDSEDTSVSASSPTASGSASQTYPTAPLNYPKNPQTQDSARLIEGRRIAGSLVPPTLIDPSYTSGGDISTLPLRGPAAMAVLFTPPVPTVAQRAGMLSGFSSARTDGAQNALLVAAFEFGTAAQAKAAAPALAAAAADKDSDKGKAVVPGFPTSTGWYGNLDEGRTYYQSFLAQGRMVIYVYISGKKLATPAQQGALAAKTFLLESAGIGKFVPTAPDKLMSLTLDRDGLRAHTLPRSQPTVKDGIYTAAGQLHYDSDPVGTRTLFGGAGVDLVSDGRATVYRATNAAGATAIRDDFVAFVQKSGSMQPYSASVGVPSAKCLQEALNSSYYCVGTQGRYAFELSADSEGDLAAAMKAQFDLLGQF